MENKSGAIKILIALSVYAAAMALVEAAVVVYLRELYYSGGFIVRTAADLAVMPSGILNVELWREAATIVMLAAVGYLSSRKPRGRLAAFLFAFSVWDLAYYLFLYLFLRWPPSLATLDVYFLIPRAWIGPVWFPLVLFTILGIAAARYILAAGRRD